jgi:MFS family permease
VDGYPAAAFSRLVYPLAIGQLVLWGTLFFSFTLFIGPLGNDLGWKPARISAAFSLSLVTAGFAAFPVGRWIDRRGGFWPLVAGSLGSAVLLALLSTVESYVSFLVIWIGLGLCMAAVLSQPAYAVFVQQLGPHAQLGITISTFATAFAATIFLPLASGFISLMGWRLTLLLLAGFNLLCAALHAYAVPRQPPEKRSSQPQDLSASEHSLKARGNPYRSLAFWGVTISFAANAAVTTALAVHLILILQQHHSLGESVTVLALMGPAQLAVRFAMIALAKTKVSYAWIGFWTMVMQLIALVILVLGAESADRKWLLFVFGILHGMAGGASVIVRAVVTTEIFGKREYAAVQGAMQLIIMLARAGAPVAIAIVAQWGGASGVMRVLLALGSVSIIAMAFAVSRTVRELR